MKRLLILVVALCGIFITGCSSSLSEEDAMSNYVDLVKDLRSVCEYSIDDFSELQKVEFNEKTYGVLVEEAYDKDSEIYYLNLAINKYNDMVNISIDYNKNKSEDIQDAFEDTLMLYKADLIMHEKKSGI